MFKSDRSLINRLSLNHGFVVVFHKSNRGSLNAGTKDGLIVLECYAFITNSNEVCMARQVMDSCEDLVCYALFGLFILELIQLKFQISEKVS